MFRNILILLAVLTVIPLTAAAQSIAAETKRADLYFLAIGAGNSLDPEFAGLRSARASAEVVARSLVEAGARFGIVLTSHPDAPGRISRQDVRDAVQRLKDRIRADAAPAPRVVVYIMGHGVADPGIDSVFVVPDTLDIAEDRVDQEHMFRLARRALFNTDMAADWGLFRRDPRFACIDGLIASRAMSDSLGRAQVRQQTRRLARLGLILSRCSASYGDAPMDLRPVPFVVLWDNCTAGFNATITGTNPEFETLMQGMGDLLYGSLLDVGRTYYAVSPGRLASPAALDRSLADPADFVETRVGPGLPTVGPLAAHLRRLVREDLNPDGMSLAAFDAVFGAPSPTVPAPPHRPPAPALRPDVAQALFLPGGPAPATVLDRPDPGAGAPVRCCAVID